VVIIVKLIHSLINLKNITILVKIINNNLVVNSLNSKSDLNNICGPRCSKLEPVKKTKYFDVILDFRLK